MPDPIQQSGAGVDLSPRVVRSATVVGSPAAAAETIIAQVTVGPDLALGLGCLVLGYAAYTVGTDGTAVQFRIRRASVAGTAIKASGALTRTAAQLWNDSVVAFDTGAVLPNQIYCLTMIVTLGSAPSTVSAVELVAIAI